MVRSLEGFLMNYSVVSHDGSRIGTVESCYLDMELGMITHLAMRIQDHQIALPFENCIIDHRLKEVKLPYR